MRAKAAISDGRGDFSIDEIELGEPQAGEVLIKIKASGVCHTDFDHMREWKLYEVMGHEGAGTVEAIGENVSHVSVGDRVLLNWAIPCGSCFQCARGAESICEQKPIVPKDRFLHRGNPISTSFGLGTMSTHTIVPKEAVVKLNVEIPFASASILGCGVMTGYGSVVNAAKVAPESSMVVLGVGGVGLSVIQTAKIAAAAKIIAVDVNENRLKLARRFGATDTVLADREDIGLLKAANEIKQMTDGRGADYAFECTSVPELGSAPLAMVRDGGIAVGVSGIEQKISFDMELFEWDKIYINPLYGQCRPQVDFPRLLDLYAQKRLMLDEMITRTYPLESLGEAFADMLAGKNAKGVLLFDD